MPYVACQNLDAVEACGVPNKSSTLTTTGKLTAADFEAYIKKLIEKKSP